MRVLRDLLRDYRFAVGFALLILLLTLALLSLFSPYDPIKTLQVPRDQPPGWRHFLGTDSRGKDVFWEATFAVRNSLALALITAVLSRIVAILIGFVAGHKGGVIDRVFMGIADGFLVIPLLLIIVTLAMLLRARMTLVNTALLLAFFGWAWDARMIRSLVLSLREREFTLTSVLSGNSVLRILKKEYLPYATPLIFSTFINNMGWVIGMEVVLAILGLVRLEIPTLGTMLRWALTYQALLLGRWWWILTPVVLIAILLIGLYWVSVGISEYLDPRMRIQRVKI